MNPIDIPQAALVGRPDCSPVNMGPPEGVSGDDVGTVQMLIDVDSTIPGMAVRRQYAYYRPTPEELELLAAGGFIEVAQYGMTVQPFGAAIWPALDQGQGAPA